MKSAEQRWQDADLDLVDADRRMIASGPTAAQVVQWVKRWRPLVQPPPAEEEPFDLVDTAGRPIGVTAPRWLCHLMGLCHRTVHLALRAPQGYLVLQVRSPHKRDWPGALDLAVTGHVPAGRSWQEAIIGEAAEELGLDVTAQAGTLAWPGLRPVGEPYCRRQTDRANPPVHICHVTQLYAATLTAAGLSGLRFYDGEVAGLVLCDDREALRLMDEEPARLAPGLVQSLPRFLAWDHGGR